jgi:tRNA (guanine9-N1)-methyltransferase
MEAEERPAKLRKLEHSALNEEHTLADGDVSNKIPPSQMTPDAHGKPVNHFESTATDGTETNEPDADASDSPASEDHAEPETPGEQPTSAVPLSKSALKKIRNKERWDAGRDARKLRRKQKIAEKRIRKRAARDEAQTAAAAAAAEKEANRKGKKTTILQDNVMVRIVLIEAEDVVGKPKRPMYTLLPVTFVIDCGFDNLMTEREMISLGSQLTRSYSDNHKAPFQAHIFVSSWGGQLKKRFDTVLEKHHENWRGVAFLEEDFVEAAERAKELMKGQRGGKLAGAFATETNGKMGITNNSEHVVRTAAAEPETVIEQDRALGNPRPAAMASEEEEHVKAQKSALAIDKDAAKPRNGVATEPELSTDGDPQNSKDNATAQPVEAPEVAALQEGEVVYLTSDSPHTLDQLQPYSTYIIGGLVDKNRHKGICYKTACARGIKTAKLPIGEFMEMQSRFVLATNHVVEIMVRWLECGDWGESFVKVMPKRKGGVLKAAYGTKQDAHGVELEVEDITPRSGDSTEAEADLQGGDVLHDGQNVPSLQSVS